MTNQMTVHKLDALGNELWVYSATVLARGRGFVRLEGRYDRGEAERGGIVIRRGDRMVETHYSDRWYNVFAVFDGEGDHLKGWYCNVTRPARIEADDIYADDLALDLVALPDGRCQALDEDEFEALPLSEDDRRRALQALAELQALAAAGKLPFDFRGRVS